MAKRIFAMPDIGILKSQGGTAMSTISNTMTNYAESAAIYNSTSSQSKKAQDKESQNKTTAAEEKMEIVKNEDTAQKVKVSGRTIGNPMLSEKAAKYYDELRKKYGNMDFILVSKDQKEYAKANASKYGNSNKMVVLIDEEKIERMAEDEKYRKQYEQVIANGAKGLTQMKTKLAQMGVNVKSCGIKVNDNGASSFFATMDKSFKAQNKKRAEKQAAKKAQKKADEKKAQKKKQQEKIEEGRTERKDAEENEEITFEADSIDELLKKIENMDYVEQPQDKLREMEQKVGRQFDYSI